MVCLCKLPCFASKKNNAEIWKDRLTALSELSSITSSLYPDYNLKSRIHRLSSYIPSTDNRSVWIKRDDELGSGIIGSKLRKLAGIIPAALASACDEVLLLGSAKSNFVSAALQLLNENSIRSKLFLLRSHDESLIGNQLWISLLHDLKQVRWIEREEWKNAHEMAEDYRKEQEEAEKKVFIILEGGKSAEAVVGAMSLADDILRNEKEKGVRFDHIFADSGTGITAIGMLLGFMKAGGAERNFYITLIAGNEEELRQDYDYYKDHFFGRYNLPFDLKLTFLRPPINASFGAVGPQVLEGTKAIARQEGILAEPLYTVKHLLAARKHIAENSLSGDILIVNSGGAFGLSAYQDKLAGQL
jgi:1-aminocyclopropane-1-carboxylate deaminase/D-cysteine desulfhydrase-like pyridoxal-dependent ACC family enzyme